MPKYYVLSGKLKTVIDRKSHESAAIDSFRRLRASELDKLSVITIVSEHGFSVAAKDSDVIFETSFLLSSAGFKIQEGPEDTI